MPSHFTQQTWRRGAVAVLVAGLTGSGLVASSAVSTGADSRDTLTKFGFDAQSYGSQTSGNDNADSGATALSVLPCSAFVPRRVRNFDASTTDGAGVQLTNVETINETAAGANRTQVSSLVTAESGSLGGGDIQFSNLRGRVLAYKNFGTPGYEVETFSTVGSLTVGSVPVPVAANTPVTVPTADGTLYVNRAESSGNRQQGVGVVNVLRYVRNDGTVERVGRAYTRMDGDVAADLFAGAAWGSESKRSDGMSLGRSALQPMPCPGTDGEVIVTRTARGDTAGGFIGARRSEVNGVVGPNGGKRGYTLATIDRAGFGVLEFRNIRAKANVVRTADGQVQRDAAGTGVGTITVGTEVQNPPAGERQVVPGVGEYTVKVVEKSRTGIDSTGVIVRLYNGTPNNRTDDTLYDLGRARLAINRG